MQAFAWLNDLLQARMDGPLDQTARDPEPKLHPRAPCDFCGAPTWFGQRIRDKMACADCCHLLPCYDCGRPIGEEMGRISSYRCRDCRIARSLNPSPDVLRRRELKRWREWRNSLYYMALASRGFFEANTSGDELELWAGRTLFCGFILGPTKWALRLISSPAMPWARREYRE